MPFANPLVLKLLDDMRESNVSSLVQSRNMSTSIKIELFIRGDLEHAAVQSYMTTRIGTMGKISRRILSLETSLHSRDEVVVVPHLVEIVGGSNSHASDEKFLEGKVISRQDIISSDISEGESESGMRKTSLLKIDLQSCGSEFCSLLLLFDI